VSSAIQLIFLLLTTAIWGFGFIATRWTLELFDPLWANTLRYVLAGILALPILIMRGSFKGDWRRHRGAVVAGLFLFSCMYLQVWGLVHTTVAKSGFLTTFYVFFTPILGILLFRERYPWTLWFCIALSLIGVALLGDLRFDGLNRGDALTIGCALLGAAHIVVIARLAHTIHDPIEFNFMQCLSMGVIGVPFALLIEGLPPLSELGPMSSILGATPLGGLFFLAVFSSLIAFTMQVVAQKAIPAHLVSMIFLLESLFAAFFGWLVLGEGLSALNMGGAFIILLSVMLAPMIEYKKKAVARTALSSLEEEIS
jgi:drug/metabolite transporter (DMT)-like permease